MCLPHISLRKSDHKNIRETPPRIRVALLPEPGIAHETGPTPRARAAHVFQESRSAICRSLLKAQSPSSNRTPPAHPISREAAARLRADRPPASQLNEQTWT